MTLVYALILFMVLIFPHELGHFLVAKAVGVKVNEFSFGMGPSLFHRQKGETLYSIRAIPVGGYCAMEGEDGDSDDERSFNSKPAWAKLSVLFAGAGMNVLIAVLVLSLMMGIAGSATTVIEEVKDGSPAYEAGIEPGDRITAVNGEKTEQWADAAEAISESEDQVSMTLDRDGDSFSADMVPAEDEDGRMIIGITAELTHNPFTAVKNGCIGAWGMTKAVFLSVKMLVTGEASASDIAGPVGIVSMVSETKTYGLGYFGFLVAFISLNLAIINLLPFPALDGGRIIFVIIRAVTKKDISDETEGKIHFIGMMLLFALLIFATGNDIVRLFK